MKRKLKLSTARSRTEIIAGYGYGSGRFAEAPPADDATPASDAPKGAPSGDQADAAVGQAISSIKDAVARAQEAQGNDPDNKDPIDAKVSDLLNQIEGLVGDLETAQATDTDSTTKPVVKPPALPDAPTPPIEDNTASGANRFAEAPPTTAADPATPPKAETPKTNPVDDKGNVDNDAVCSDADCGHYASAHDNQDEGINTGACGMKECECLAMKVDSDSNPKDDSSGEDTTSGGPNNAGGDSADPANTIGDHTARAGVAALADGPVGSVPPAPAGAPTLDDGDEMQPVDEDLNAPPEMAGGMNMGPAFTIPVAIIEGQPTGDGREIAPGALSWRVPPLPLMGLATETHDPMGFDMNDPAVICGRIDSFERVAGEGGTQIITAKGFYLANDDGMYFADLNEQMGRIGVSADVAVDEQQINVEEMDEDGWPVQTSQTLTKGTIMGLTVCPYAAFEGAYIVLGDGGEIEAIPQAAESAKVPAAVAAGGQLIHFMAYEDCGCDEATTVIVASGGPARPPKSWFDDPNFTEGDGRLQEILNRDGKREFGGKFACPVEVTEDGRVFGHIAPWGICHTGVAGECILAPHSAVDYAHFKRGQHVITAEGDKVRVGVLTADTGHAKQDRRTSPSAAMAHYDNTALACADVNIGEDEYGIWIAGAMRSDATEEQVRKVRAMSPSGDWRRMGGQLELVAALCVNEPGFPLAVVASGHVESLTASGAAVMYRLKHPVPPAPAVDEGDVILRRALSPLLGQAKTHARERLAKLGA